MKKHISIYNYIILEYLSNCCQSGESSVNCVPFFGVGSHNFDSADIALLVFCTAEQLRYIKRKLEIGKLE